MTLCALGVPLTLVLFAVFAEDATTIMMMIVLVFVMLALYPARLVIGCDGFAFGGAQRARFPEGTRRGLRADSGRPEPRGIHRGRRSLR
jgi:hypothetical protein